MKTFREFNEGLIGDLTGLSVASKRLRGIGKIATNPLSVTKKAIAKRVAGAFNAPATVKRKRKRS
jgi:hypothetical protein